MDQDQSQALVDLANDVRKLNEILGHGNLSQDKINEAYERVLAVRCNANLVKSYVLEKIEQNTVMA